MRSICENPRVKKMNEERAKHPVYPPFEPYTTVDQLRAAAENFVANHQTLWRKGVALPQEQIDSSRKHYAELREALLSIGEDINGLPRRLRVKSKGVAA
jgi:hypothetical protein